MKKFLILLTGIYICGVLPAVAGELPKNPWASQNQTVKINTPENRKQTQPTNSANSNQQWVQDRVSAIQRHNAQVNADYAARAKAEQERLKQEAEAAASSSDSGEGFMDKLGSFFSDDSSSSANSAPSSSGSSGDFEMPGADLLQGYDDLKKETEKSVRKLKHNFNSLTNVNIEKTIDDTLKSLQ